MGIDQKSDENLLYSQDPDSTGEEHRQAERQVGGERQHQSLQQNRRAEQEGNIQ